VKKGETWVERKGEGGWKSLKRAKRATEDTPFPYPRDSQRARSALSVISGSQRGGGAGKHIPQWMIGRK